MTDHAKLIERLRQFAAATPKTQFKRGLLLEAASALEEREGLAKRLEEMIERQKIYTAEAGDVVPVQSLEYFCDAALHPSPVEEAGCDD